MAVGIYFGLGVLKFIVFNLNIKLLFRETIDAKPIKVASTYVKFPKILCMLESLAANLLAICLSHVHLFHHFGSKPKCMAAIGDALIDEHSSTDEVLALN